MTRFLSTEEQTLLRQYRALKVTGRENIKSIITAFLELENASPKHQQPKLQLVKTQ